VDGGTLIGGTTGVGPTACPRGPWPPKVAARVAKADWASARSARLQRLTDGLEILGASGVLKRLTIRVRAALSESGEGVEVRLRRAQVAGLQILAKLGDVGSPLLPVGAQLLVDGGRVSGCGGRGCTGRGCVGLRVA